jgi:hypothetical protein
MCAWLEYQDMLPIGIALATMSPYVILGIDPAPEQRSNGQSRLKVKGTDAQDGLP